MATASCQNKHVLTCYMWLLENFNEVMWNLKTFKRKLRVCNGKIDLKPVCILGSWNLLTGGFLFFSHSKMKHCHAWKTWHVAVIILAPFLLVHHLWNPVYLHWETYIQEDGGCTIMPRFDSLYSVTLSVLWQKLNESCFALVFFLYQVTTCFAMYIVAMLGIIISFSMRLSLLSRLRYYRFYYYADANERGVSFKQIGHNNPFSFSNMKWT